MDNARRKDNFRIAEWILARASSNERAAEIVGDLLEQGKDTVSLWLSVLRIVFAMHWRWLVAVPAAMFSIFLALKPYADFVVFKEISNLQHTTPAHFGVQPMSLTLKVGVNLVLPAVCLWTVAALSLFRFGYRNAITCLGALLALLFTVASCSIELPHAVFLSPAVLALTVGMLLLHRPFRKPIFCISITAFTFFAAFMAYAASISAVLSRQLAFSTSFLFPFVALGGYLLTILIESWVLSRTHRWIEA